MCEGEDKGGRERQVLARLGDKQARRSEDKGESLSQDLPMAALLDKAKQVEVSVCYFLVETG